LGLSSVLMLVWLSGRTSAPDVKPPTAVLLSVLGRDLPLPGPASVLMNSIPIVRERVLHIVVVESPSPGAVSPPSPSSPLARSGAPVGAAGGAGVCASTGGAGNRRRAGRRHDRLAGGLAVVQDAMTMLEIASDESGGGPGRLLHARGT